MVRLPRPSAASASRVVVGGEPIHFERGEPIVTEYSYKYRGEALENLAAAAGWQPQRMWTDVNRWFSVQFLVLT